MARRMLAFDWQDRLIVAHSINGAKRLIRERFETTRGGKVRRITGRVPYCDQEGEIIGKVSGSNCGSVWPVPMIVPEP